MTSATGPPHAPPVTMGQLLCAFAYATDLAFGLQLEDSLRSCYIAVRMADALGLSAEQREATYYAALLKDAGCTSWTTELAQAWQTDEIVARRELLIFGNHNDPRAFTGWMRRFVAHDRSLVTKLSRYVGVLTTRRTLIAQAFATATMIAQRIAGRLAMPEGVQRGVFNVFEQWNGGGAPSGLRGEQIPRVARLVLPTFFLAPVHRVSGREAAVQLARTLRGQAFDPAASDAFLRLASDPSFWADLEASDIQRTILALEAPTTLPPMTDAMIDNVALAFADFIDLKSRYIAAHSRRVGAVAEQLARAMGRAEADVVQIRRAALMHDLGLVAVPSYILDRPWGALSAAEQDAYRLHPYHGERVLMRVPALAPLAEMVGTHQERLDGSGYYRGLSGPSIGLGARIIAVADRLDQLTHDRPGSPACSITDALCHLEQEPLDLTVLAALRRCLGERTVCVAAPRGEQPAGLTAREIEVLRLAARGHTRREVGRRLAITENTVRHHLEHIYNKTGTANRVSATLFAMERGLLADWGDATWDVRPMTGRRTPRFTVREAEEQALGERNGSAHFQRGHSPRIRVQTAGNCERHRTEEPTMTTTSDELTAAALRDQLRGTLIRPGDADYDTARAVWNGMIDRSPALIVRPAGPEDVIAAVNLARESGLPLAVRGGGHSAAGLSVCDGGIVIDLSSMKAVEVDPDARTARAQGGATWGDFDAATAAHGLATTGGLISSTGVAGLTLGGGLGWLMRQYGLACDNLRSVEVVTADGRLVTASASENTDLFWGLRGGGGNFGVATSFQFRLHPVRRVLAGMLVHPIERAGEVLRLYRQVTATAPDALTVFAPLMTTPEGATVIALVVCYNGPITEGEVAIERLREFAPALADTVQPMAYVELQRMLDKAFPHGLQVYWRSHFLTGLPDAAIDTIAERFAGVTSPLSTVIVEPMGGAVGRVGRDASAFDQRSAAYNLAIIGRWTEPAEADRHTAWARDMWEATRPYASGVYVNYLGVGDGAERVRDAYGPAKYERLAALKAKYDPGNLFRLNQNIVPSS